MNEDWRIATPEEIDSDELAIAVANRLIGQQIGYRFVVTEDGNGVFVEARKSLAGDEFMRVTLDNVDDFLATRRAERIARQLNRDAN